MRMPVIGTVYQSMKLTQMKYKARLRAQDPYMPKGEEEIPERKSLYLEADRVRRGNLIASLDSKLKSGVELSNEEMQFLKQNNSELYQEACDIKKEREAYKKELEGCKSKEEVEEHNMQKMQRFLSEARTVEANPNIPKGEKQRLLEKILKRVMGVKQEHTSFLSSASHQRLENTRQEAEEAERPQESGQTAQAETQQELPAAPAEEGQENQESYTAPEEKPAAFYTAKGEMQRPAHRKGQRLLVKI